MIDAISRTSLMALAGCCLLASLPATATDWTLLPDDSAVEFVATQQGARFRGHFDQFDADVQLDPDAPDSGQIVATVRTASVDTGNSERDGYLRGSDWFAVEQYPEARFTTRDIRRGEEGFIADGELTLREVTKPVEFRFRLEPLQAGRAKLTGSMDISRLEFGVGRGDWEDTSWVGDPVSIEVELLLSNDELRAGEPAGTIGRWVED